MTDQTVPAERVTSDVETNALKYQNEQDGKFYANPIYPQHKYGKLFPQMTIEQRQALTLNILQNGQMEPIVIYEDAVLDGWHRYSAQQWLGAEADFAAYGGTDDEALEFVLSANYNRRHLSTSQRALIASETATLRPGRPPLDIFAEDDGSMKPKKTKTLSEAAKEAGVGRRTVQVARALTENAKPEVVDAVRQGKVSLRKAEEISKLPDDDQTEALENAVLPSTPKAAAEREAKAEQRRKEQEAAKAKSVDIEVYDALMTERDELKSKLDEAIDLLSTQKAFDDGSPQAEMIGLRQRLKAAETKRDNLMTENASLKKEKRDLEAQVKKLTKKSESAF